MLRDGWDSLNMASGMDGDRESLPIPLLSITAVHIVSLFSTMVAFSYGHSLLSGIVILVSLALFALSLVVLPWMACRCVTVHGMAKMEAWWWLSAPYSVAFALCALVFPLRDVHTLALFVLIAIITAVSSVMWLLATILELALFETESLTAKKNVMLALVVLAGILWVILRVSPGR